ncbi:TetR/AcrR family transcriptional regulator [Nocardioides sp. GY 10113]|uniref:TetR/AcrR family transcriptional regulator n=1 Tax=Nocardioides sp. GY 10113 TaxID=2569761 RepID=UPI0019805923|nr:TetR/AcrR family transcriptional regulator [Nocardioides sp. GY 10113]
MPDPLATSARPRRTQAERRATTRALILDSTAACLLEVGLAATTVSEVQDRTGLARGTIQHHFPTRAELLVGAVSHLVDARIERFRADAALIDPDADRMEAVVDLIWRDLSSPIFFAALELWVAARTDPDLRAALLPEEARLLATMRTMYAENLGDPLATDPRTASLVELTVDLLTGLSMLTMLGARASTRESVVRNWKQALRTLWAGQPAEDPAPDLHQTE